MPLIEQHSLRHEGIQQPEASSTEYPSSLIPNTIKSMGFWNQKPQYWVLGPSRQALGLQEGVGICGDDDS